MHSNVISAVANISTEFGETVKAWSLATPLTYCKQISMPSIDSALLRSDVTYGSEVAMYRQY